MRLRFAWVGLLAGLCAADAFAAEPAPAPRAAGESIHRLGPDAHQLRFEGETSAKSWAIYVTAAQAQTRARIHLSYSNAISVMPEVSTLAISVNDSAVAQTPIAAASDPGGVDVELPRGLLAAGYNTVRIAVTQRHRVDCSLEATYELWTQLDPAVSGLTFPGISDAAIATLDDLAAISPEASGAVPIRAVLADDADPAAIDRVLRAVENVAIRAGIVRPAVEITDAIDDRPGLWVLTGLRTELRAHGFGRFVGESDDPALMGGDVPGRVIVVAAGADARQTAESIEEILPTRRAENRIATTSAARTLAGVNGFPVAGNMSISLHDLGVQTEEFNGRLFRSGFDITMPPDFYPADYDKMTLSVSAGYSAGLSQGAQILVRVNDKEAGSLPLRNPKGDLFRDRPISISLSALRPGINHVVVEAQTPTEEDAACDVRNLMDSKKRFVLFDTSELEMPSLARIARMPNLAVTLSSGFPYQGASASQIFLAKHDRPTIGAAATFLARTAFVSRQPITARVTFDRGAIGAGSVMFFGALEDFGPNMFERFMVDYRALKEAWARPNPGEGPAAEAPTPAAAAVAAGSPNDVYDQWAEGVKAEPITFGARESVRALYDRYINVHRGDFALLRDPDGKIEVPDRATLLVTQAHGPITSSPDTWTLVVAANAASLTRDMRGLVAPSNWNFLEGRASVFGPKTGASNISRPVDSYFIQTQSLTPTNLRLVAAGWLSSNIDYYVIAVALMALILGGVTFMTVRAHGVQR